MVISDWLSQNSVSQKDFARQIGVTANAVCQWCNGIRIPRRKEMKRIYRQTGGAVQPNDFYDLALEEQERGEAA